MQCESISWRSAQILSEPITKKAALATTEIRNLPSLKDIIYHSQLWSTRVRPIPGVGGTGNTIEVPLDCYEYVYLFEQLLRISAITAFLIRQHTVSFAG
jgi:hypothetical protein